MSKEEANYFKAIKSKTTQKDNTNENTDENMIEDDVSSNLNYTDEVEDELEKEKNDLRTVKSQEEKEKNTLTERHKNALHLLLYGCFIVVFTWALLEFNQVQVSSYTQQGLNNFIFSLNFPVNSSDPNSFAGINLYQDFTNFMTGPFIKAIFSSTDYNGNPLTEDQKKYVARVYKKVGPVRFLQKRVITTSCKQDFSDVLGRNSEECFKDFSSDNEYKATLVIPGIPSNYSD